MVSRSSRAGQPTFNVTGAVRITGPLDQGALKRSVSELVSRHESLRTTFVAIDGTPHQVIARDLDLALDAYDLTEFPSSHRQAELERRALEDARRPFDLVRGPLARVSLLRLGDAEHVVLLTMHHLVTDGWSLSVAASELVTLYESHRRGSSSHIPLPPIQYADFARWQRDQFESGAWQSQIDRWRNRLAGVPPLELPTDRPRPPIRSARGAMHPLVLSPELSHAVRALGRREECTPYMILLATFQLLLGRWSSQDDFAIGSPVANRTRGETEKSIGYFVNMLALRADLSGNPTVREFLARVREVALEAFENQEIPLEVLIPVLGPRRDASRSPLFQVMFVLQNNALPRVRPLDLTLSPLELDQGTGTSKFDLALGFEDTPETFAGTVEFNTDLFETGTIERFSRHYVDLLESFVAHPELRLSELSLLSDNERREVVEWSHEPKVASEGLRILDRLERPGIHGLFESQVCATPDRLALVADEYRLTYAELNARANRLAHHLRSYGVGPEVRVGLVLNDPLHRIVAVLGVLKAGGAYVPLEPSLPRPRLEGMLEAAGVSLVIVDRSAVGQVQRSSETMIDLDSDRAFIALQRPEDLDLQLDSENLAYVIFTSGTTGRPKGVMVSHGALLAVAAAWESAYELGNSQLRHLQAAGFSFDVFTGDWVRALTTGGTLVACPRPVLLDPAALADLLRRERIECMELVPALADALATHLELQGEDLEGLRLLAVGSDTVRWKLYRRLSRLVGPGGRVVNSYGLTETTIDSTYFGGPPEYSEGDGPVPIGRPMTGTRVYLLDRWGELVAKGLIGELYIGGSGVARGYLADPRQTAERFMPDPYGAPGSRIYATGDLARWREGGVLELLGRRDGQVKVRGFRVELAEVENALCSCPGVIEAAVVAREDGVDGQRLIACIVGDGAQTPGVDTIRRYLRERVPGPMIPSRIWSVKALPRTPSGKVDRQGLVEAQPHEESTAQGHVSPRDELEAQLAVLWEDLLQIRPIGVTDDFFDLGGHSLLAVRLAARIEQKWGRSLALSDLLMGSTIQELASRLREKVKSSAASSLIPLGTSGPGHPLFLVHPIGGGVLCYNVLARRLDGAHAVLGLQAAGLDGEVEPEADLARMASRYVERFWRSTPRAPTSWAGGRWAASWLSRWPGNSPLRAARSRLSS